MPKYTVTLVNGTQVTVEADAAHVTPDGLKLLDNVNNKPLNLVAVFAPGIYQHCLKEQK